MIGLRKSATAQVSEVLALQYKALLAGDLTRLGTLAPLLEQAFTRLRRDKASADEIAPLMIAAARNARLVQAAQSGVAQARAHLSAERAPELTTYDARGQSRAGVAPSTRTLSRR